MRRSLRMFVIGLVLGIGGTLAVTEEKIAVVRTEDGLKIECNVQFIEKNRDRPRQFVEFVKNAWQE